MFEPERYNNQYKCTSANCFYLSAEVVNIIDHIKIIHKIDPVFNFECVNRLPIRCRRKFLTFLGLEKLLKKGLWYLSGYDHGSIWRLSVPKAGGSNLHPVILFRDNVQWKGKNRWFMGSLPQYSTPNHLIPMKARLGKRNRAS